MPAKKTVKNPITLPKAIVEKLPKTDYFEISLRGEEIVLRPVASDPMGNASGSKKQIPITLGARGTDSP
jgi:hypothetical protein